MKCINFNFDETQIWEGERGFKKGNNFLIDYYVCTANEKKYEIIIQINESSLARYFNPFYFDTEK